MAGRYDTAGNIEDQYQPGSNGRILRNKLDIFDPELIETIEGVLLAEVEITAAGELESNLQLTKEYIFKLHHNWLGDLYEWAGRPRTVNISKAGVIYCPAENIEMEMDRFEYEVLLKYTPCDYTDIRKIANAMAIVHGEFEIIHPFREGNGRLGRLIASLMANQAGFNLENLSAHIKENWERYIEGLNEAWDGSYKILNAIFEEVLNQEAED